MGKLRGYKTYIIGAVTIVGAVASYLTGDSTLQESLNLAIPALLAMTVRHGITTEANK